MKRALINARRAQGLAIAPRALTRRQALVLGAAAGLAACATAKTPGSTGPRAGKIAIVGGGTAGLTAAYRLAQAGADVALYEAQPRFGGRMLTKRNFNADGMFCELGGELVDTGHKELIDLANELGVGVQRLVPENAPSLDVYDIGGEIRRGRDMIDPATRTGAFVKIAAVIARDQDALLDDNEEWTARARALDSMSLKDYLATLRPLTADWAIAALDLAFLGEYGLETSEQSALNLIDIIGVDVAEEFSVYGESDEAFRVAGGSGALPDALVAAIGARAALNSGFELVETAAEDGRIVLAFRTQAGVETVAADHAILALPFTKLRGTKLDKAGISVLKRRAIAELGYGQNSKLMVGTTSRPWTKAGATADAKGLVDGVLYSDRGFQCLWETSRGQDGASGVLTNFLSTGAALASEEEAYNELECGLGAISEPIANALDPKTRAFMAWPRHPFVMGSYSSPRVGQYTTLLDVVAAPEAGGRLHFAGEHTSAEWLGFMNGAVSSGERAAREILGTG
jgi:monoamine oxidase